MRTTFHAILPLTDETETDGRVVLAFLAYAAVRPAAAPLTGTGDLIAYLRDLVPDPAAAPGLLALMEGLGVHRLTGLLTKSQVVAALDCYLDAVFS